MTEHCETCRFWITEPRTSPKPMCVILEQELIAEGVYPSTARFEVLQPPADFGCIYHEARPEKKCGNCEHHTRHPEDYAPGWRFCRAQTIMGVKNVITTDRHTCDEWSEKK